MQKNLVCICKNLDMKEKLSMKKIVLDKKNNLFFVFWVYFICLIFRSFEYFLIRTDKTFLGEAVIHKLLGIFIFLIVIKISTISNIGFAGRRKIFNLLKGLALGIFSFIVAYCIELFVFIGQNNFLKIEFYVTSYSPMGNIGKQISLIAFIVCIFGNIINVIMEEGFFRGLLQKLLEIKYPFYVSAIISSCLFGLWHIIFPLRSLYDGHINLTGFILNGLILIITSTFVGFNFVLITKLSRSLYMAMAYHFINNTFINIIHIISNTGVDQYMIMRISIVQIFSSVVVLIWYFSEIRKK